MANEKCNGCSLYIGGHCIKWRKNGKCEISDNEWLDEKCTFISSDRMCEKSSIFGNAYVGLTMNDIDRLKNGEIIHIDVEEYCAFIGLKGENT